ncbi:hypothetical protein [Microbulbifer sp. JMSA003]|uniref:hypothetical protein n=1 Tax=Microbulbifer sp. JMSA003 TaxID=3243369 RepID=UPI00403A7408
MKKLKLAAAIFAISVFSSSASADSSFSWGDIFNLPTLGFCSDWFNQDNGEIICET